MSKLNYKGSLDLKYAVGRDLKKSLRYRLWRRTQEVFWAIEKYAIYPARDIIDLGTADGRMLDFIQKKYPQARCVGVEISRELVDFGRAKYSHLEILHGDIEYLNFPTGSFDIAIATAVIEHVCNPRNVMIEIKRILRRNGILILTTPDPVWENLASVVGHLDKEHHQNVMNLKKLREMALQDRFSILEAKKFMVSPIGMPFELEFERLLRRLHLGCLMANQLLVARC